MLPMTSLMLATVVGLSATFAWMAAAQQRKETEQQLRDVAQTLGRSSFPLTDSVLGQMKGLAGAEFVLLDDTGAIRATTRQDWELSDLPRETASQEPPELLWAKTVKVGDEKFFHAAVLVTPRDPSTKGQVLNILYPVELYERELRAAVYPAIVIGCLSLLLVAAAASAIAARVSRPLSRLQRQVDRIAKGDFQPLPLPPNQDEIRDLSQAVNHMAEMLALYERKIRHTEQVRTLGQLGGALAHQLRNSVTGARMAVDLHRAECPAPDQDEGLEVATRQLLLMERYLQKFLSLGARPRRAPEEIDLAQVLESLLPLVGPAAKHAGVTLEVELPSPPLTLWGELDGIEHLLLNLLLNGVEAASEAACEHASSSAPAQVRVALASAGARARLIVEDTGSGPRSDVAGSLFEPFVTTKRDGVGLGLAIAKQVVEDHHGTIQWSRADRRTQFVVELPLAALGMRHVEVARG